MYTHKNRANVFANLFLSIESGGFRLPVFEYRVRGFAVPAAGGPLQTAVPDLVVVLLRLSLLQMEKFKIKYKRHGGPLQSAVLDLVVVLLRLSLLQLEKFKSKCKRLGGRCR